MFYSISVANADEKQVVRFIVSSDHELSKDEISNLQKLRGAIFAQKDGISRLIDLKTLFALQTPENTSDALKMTALFTFSVNIPLR